MRNYTTIKKSYDAQILKNIVCDICNDVSTNEWKEDSFDITECTVYMKTGSMYGNDGSGENINIDVCPKCFRDKLIPWVKSFGGEPTITEWDT